MWDLRFEMGMAPFRLFTPPVRLASTTRPTQLPARRWQHDGQVPLIGSPAYPLTFSVSVRVLPIDRNEIRRLISHYLGGRRRFACSFSAFPLSSFSPGRPLPARRWQHDSQVPFIGSPASQLDYCLNGGDSFQSPAMKHENARHFV